MSDEMKELFPAWAGVILCATIRLAIYVPFPRMGGGDPQIVSSARLCDHFSPHGRG